MKPKTTSTELTWLTKEEGLPLFCALPPQLVVDPRVTPADLRIFCALLMHADLDGRLVVSQERLAELLGFASTKCIKNAIASGSREGPGGKLVQLGYVINHGQTGFDKCNLYQLVAAPARDVPLNKPKNRKLPDTDYAAKTKTANAAKQRAQASKEFYTLPDGEIILKAEAVGEQRAYNNEGEAPTLPDAVFSYFGLKLTAPEL